MFICALYVETKEIWTSGWKIRVMTIWFTWKSESWLPVFDLPENRPVWRSRGWGNAKCPPQIPPALGPWLKRWSVRCRAALQSHTQPVQTVKIYILKRNRPTVISGNILKVFPLFWFFYSANYHLNMHFHFHV